MLLLVDDTIVKFFWLPGANWTVTALPPMVRPFAFGTDMICCEPGLFVCKLLTGKVNVIGLPCCPTLRIIFIVPGAVWTEFVLLATADVIVLTCGDETNDTKLFADDVTIEPVCTVRMPLAVVTKMICWFVRIGRPKMRMQTQTKSVVCKRLMVLVSGRLGCIPTYFGLVW